MTRAGHQLELFPRSKEPGFKERRRFLRQSKKIRALKRRIKKNEKKFKKIAVYFRSKVQSVQQETARINLALAQLLDTADRRYRYTPCERKVMAEIILLFCSESFFHLRPSAQQEALHNRWAAEPYKAYSTQQSEQEVEEMVESLKAELGIEQEEPDGSSEELDPALEAILAAPMQEYDRALAAAPKRVEKDAAGPEPQKKNEQPEELELETLSMYQIYTSLSSVLQAENPPSTRHEQLAGELSLAYLNQNLAALQRIEQQWRALEARRLAQLNEGELTRLNRILHGQRLRLELEQQMQRVKREYRKVIPYLSLSKAAAFQKLDALAGRLRERLHRQQQAYFGLLETPRKISYIKYAKQASRELYTLEEAESKREPFVFDETPSKDAGKEGASGIDEGYSEELMQILDEIFNFQSEPEDPAGKEKKERNKNR